MFLGEKKRKERQNENEEPNSKNNSEKKTRKSAKPKRNHILVPFASTLLHINGIMEF